MRRRIDWRQVLISVALAASALWLGSLIWNLGSKAQLAWQQAHDTKSEYQQLEARKATLQANLDALQTPRGQDAAVREAFGVARPGEEVIVVVPPVATSTPVKPPWWDVWAWF
jgi:cell division protein FtsB